MLKTIMLFASASIGYVVLCGVASMHIHCPVMIAAPVYFLGGYIVGGISIAYGLSRWA